MYPEQFLRCFTKLTRADIYHWYATIHAQKGLTPSRVTDYCNMLIDGPLYALRNSRIKNPSSLQEYEGFVWFFLVHEDYRSDYK